MRANAWRTFLDEQRSLHGKVLFTVTELANVAGTSRAALNVELARLRGEGSIAKYAHGLYGLPGAVTPRESWSGPSIRTLTSPVTTRFTRTAW